MISAQFPGPSPEREQSSRSAGAARELSERLLLVSAADKAALAARLRQLALHLATPGTSVADTAYTLARGRRAMAHRACIVLPERGPLQHPLDEADAVRKVTGSAKPGAASVALMFPGQGAQFIGMGRGLYAASAHYRNTFDHCDAFLSSRLGFSLRELLLTEPTQADAARTERLTQTAVAQPALFVVEYAMAELLLHYGVRPAVVLGHSIGEFAAACLAGVFELDAALELVFERGRLMQSMPPGAMLAVKSDPAELQELLDGAVNLAAHNAPGLSVVSGPFEGIDAFRAKAEARGLDVRALHTSHAFHSAMMEPMLDEFRSVVARANPRPPTIPIISTMSGKRLMDAEAVSSEYWANQLRNPVRFADAARAACDDAARVFVEVGPGVSLVTSVAKLVDVEHRPRKLVETLGHPKADAPATDVLLEAIGQLWIQGAAVDWERFFNGPQRELVRLPTYPYQRRLHVIEPPRPVAAHGSVPLAVESAVDQRGDAQQGPVADPGEVVLGRVKGLLESRLGRKLDGDELELKFLELGLDSLAMSQLAGKLREEFGVQVRVRQLFDQVGTPALLARHLLEQRPALGAPPLAARPAAAAPEVAAAPGKLAGVDRALEERLARIERLLEGLNRPPSAASGTDDPAPSPVAAVVPAGGAPLTASQREIWVAARIGGEAANLAYNECRAFFFEGELDEESLLGCLDALGARHEALRQTFAPDGSACFVDERVTIPLERFDLREEATDAADERLRALMRDQVSRQFELATGPLIRGTLVTLQGKHVLILCAHHVAVDGSSWEILIRELAELYSARREQRPPNLPEAVPFAEYARQERDYRESAQASRDEAFWVEALKGQTEDLQLPTDGPRPAHRTFGSTRLDHQLSPALMEEVRKASARHACTQQTLLLAAFQILMFRLTNQADMVCGVPTSGQAALGLDPLVGHCVHVLPLRVQTDGAARVADHLRGVHESMLDALEHQRATFTELLPRLSRPRDPSRPALIQVAFGMGRSQKRPRFAGLNTELRVVPRVSETFELYVYGTENAGGLEVSWSYNTDLFQRSTIELWQRCFTTLIEQMVKGGLDGAVLAIDLLSESDRAELLWRARGPQITRLGHEPIHRVFARHAANQPDRVAFIDANGPCSYRELDERANRIGHLLRSRGISTSSLVAVCLERSVDLVAALLGVWRAGAGYVPLDPAYPAVRIQAILEDSNAALVLTTRALTAGIPEGFETLCIDELAAELSQLPTTPPTVKEQPSDTAYVIFTSGSTGRPKGVVIPQGAFSNFIFSMQKEPGFSGDDCILALTTISFDISGLELFLPLATGGMAVMVSREQATNPRELQRLMTEHEVTVAQATPATWQMMFDSSWPGDPHLKVLCGGEALPRHLAEKFLTSCAEVWNVYGPTETTVWSTLKRLTDAAEITIGRPIDNTTCYILDERQNLVPRGTHGELWIGGDGVAKGYLGREDLTRERFIESPFDPNERIYRTGDLARLRADGEFECLGRVDFQVKIRGFRIELGEVETAMLAHPGVKACVAVAREDGPSDKILVGYVVPQEGQVVDIDELREHLSKSLPAYMVPSAYCALDALPMTPNKKVDRKALPAPAVAGPSRTTAEPPRNEVERRVLAIWSHVIGHPALGVNDNFYSVGGHSLMAIRLIERVNQEFQVELPVNELFNRPTVRGLSELLREAHTEGEEAAPLTNRPNPPAAPVGGHQGLFCIQEGAGDGVPFFLVHGDQGNGLLPPHLGSHQEVWGYHHQGSDGERIEFKTVQTLAEHCHREWLARHGRRPCVLGGHSFGALVAYHVAVLRQEAGLQTPRLVLIDARHPAALHFREMTRSPAGMKRWLNRVRLQYQAKRSCALAEAHLDQGRPVPLNQRRKYILGTYRLAFSEYEPPEYRGELEIIRSEEWTRSSPADYWERSVTGGIRRFVVSGTHLSIVREAGGVARVGQHLRRIFEDVAREQGGEVRSPRHPSPARDPGDAVG